MTRRRTRAGSKALPPAAQHALRQGLQAHQTGDLTSAEAAYRCALEYAPGQPAALHHLGLIHHNRGEHDEAARLIRRSLAAASDQAIWHTNLATVEQARGKPNAALNACDRAARVDPTLTGLDAQRGDLLLEAGRPEEAVTAYQAAVAAQPENADYHNNLGNALGAMGEFNHAVAAYDAALECDPGHAHALPNAASTRAGALDDPESALEVFARAPIERQGDPVIYREHARIALRAGEPDTALAVLDRHDTGHARQTNGANDDLRATALETLGRLDEARVLCASHAERARDAPTAAAWQARAGSFLEQLGKRAAAYNVYRAALAQDPRHGAAWQGLQATGRLSETDWRTLHTVAADQRLNRSNRAPVLFTLGRALEANGENDNAFEAYRQANDLVAAERPFRADVLTEYTERIMRLFTGDALADVPPAETSTPVFIVGMPRSGTTLVERMLAAHPAIAPGGERSDGPWLCRALARATATPFPEAFDHLHTGTARDLSERYRERLARLGLSETVVTDKLPANYLRLGLLRAVLPGVRIIHCRRNPLDTCVSCFATHFRQGQGFSYRLDGLATTYRLYERLMNHWQQVMPESILTVDYEDLVTDPEPPLRRMLMHCGLEWDPACLAFHQQADPVQTASVWEVRQPVNNSSVGRWRRFGRWLGPLVEAFPNAGVALWDSARDSST